MTCLELPRLRLSFQVKTEVDHTGTQAVRLYSVDHPGYFVSSNYTPMIYDLMDGIPNCLLLENIDGEKALMVPNSLPLRPMVETERMGTDVVFTRGQKEWLDNIEVRHYLYPIHLSHAFMFAADTLSSALYLLLLRFLARQYHEASQLVQSCISDTALSGEEQQIFEEICRIEDCHPNAHAIRCKISLSTADSAMNPSWDKAQEIKHYINKQAHVSANCRLLPSEELMLMESLALTRSLRNRKNYLDKLSQGGGDLELVLPKYPQPEVITLDNQ